MKSILIHIFLLFLACSVFGIKLIKKNLLFSTNQNALEEMSKDFQDYFWVQNLDPSGDAYSYLTLTDRTLERLFVKVNDYQIEIQSQGNKDKSKGSKI